MLEGYVYWSSVMENKLTVETDQAYKRWKRPFEGDGKRLFTLNQCMSR